jgi:uncharacterized protein YycO
MPTLQLLFCTNPRNPLSWMIRVGSWSRWSHVAIVSGQSVIEAVAIDGVSQRPIADRQRQDLRWQLVDFACPNPDGVIEAARSQIGKPYDYTGVLGVGLHRDWQQDDAWFCSELVAWAFQEAGCALFRPGATRRITPQDLWMLSPMVDSYCHTSASQTAQGMPDGTFQPKEGAEW